MTTKLGNYKINQPDFERLSRIILDFVDNNKIHNQDQYDITQVRYVWDIYHGSIDNCMINHLDDYFFMRRLYDYLNDNNLESALKKILKDKLS